eukprot:scaffold153681_cov61-Attheya_sp.AAC.2
MELDVYHSNIKAAIPTQLRKARKNLNQCRKTSSTLRRTISNRVHNHSPTSKILTDPTEDPKKATNWHKIFDNKHDLEAVLQERNLLHFSQAATDKTPFTQDPLCKLLQFTTDTEFGQDFLRSGNIDLTTLDLDDDMLGILEKLLPDPQNNPPEITEDIDMKEVMSGFRKWKESTTTCGRHLGHYKCWLMKCRPEEISLSAEDFFSIIVTTLSGKQ